MEDHLHFYYLLTAVKNAQETLRKEEGQRAHCDATTPVDG